MLLHTAHSNFLFQNLSLKIVNMVVLLLLAGHWLNAQSVQSPLSAPYTAIGAYSKNFTDAFSGIANPAALAQTAAAAAGIYGERRFMLKALSNYAAAISLPSKWGGFGIAAHYFGGEHFNSSEIGIGYGKKLGSKADIGVRFNYHMLQLAGYGSTAIINVEAGALLHLSEKLHMGIHVYNPAGSKFGKSNGEKLASVYTTGMGYEASDKFFISMEISKEEDKPVNILPALQYDFAKQFFTRLGISTSTGNYFFGLGVQWKSYRVDASAAWQARLGFTPAIMLLFQLHEPAQQQQIEK